MEVMSVVETCRLSDGLTVKRLRHYRCRACGARLFDAAMHRIRRQRAASPAAAARVDPLAGIRVSTGAADLAEHFDDYRFGRRP
jgi:hypothetical protein